MSKMFEQFRNDFNEMRKELQEEKALKEQQRQEQQLEHQKAIQEAYELEQQQEELYEHKYGLVGNYVTESFEAYTMEDLAKKIQDYYIDLRMNDIKYEVVNISHSTYAFEATGTNKERFFGETEDVHTHISTIKTALVTIHILG